MRGSIQSLADAIHLPVFLRAGRETTESPIRNKALAIDGRDAPRADAVFKVIARLEFDFDNLLQGG